MGGSRPPMPPTRYKVGNGAQSKAAKPRERGLTGTAAPGTNTRGNPTSGGTLPRAAWRVKRKLIDLEPEQGSSIAKHAPACRLMGR